MVYTVCFIRPLIVMQVITQQKSERSVIRRHPMAVLFSSQDRVFLVLFIFLIIIVIVVCVRLLDKEVCLEHLHIILCCLILKDVLCNLSCVWSCFRT